MHYAALPYSRGGGRIRGAFDRFRARGELLRWLREIALLAEAPDAATTQEFLTSLAALHALTALPASLRRQAQALTQAVHSGQLVPRHVPMHGDLWHGNVMRRKDGRLVLIDWGGSAMHGYGLYDLVRCALAFGLSRRRLAQEVRWHGAALGDADQTPMLHLLGALGHYARNLGEFPLERFVRMSENCVSALQRALAKP